MFRGAVASCFLLLVAPVAYAQTAAISDPGEPLRSTLARARAEDARTEYGSAVALYERYAAGCLAASTALLEPDQPCEEAELALGRAFELARALGDAAAAQRIATTYTRHLLYAEPREVTRMGYELARMHLDAGRLPDAALALERWIHLDPDSPAGRAIIVDALRGRIATGMGRTQQAALFFRRAERRFATERALLGDDGAVPLALVQEAMADARLLRAHPHVERFLASGVPRARSTRDPEALWSRVIGPWRTRVERRLLLARMELERVYELGSPRHSVVAAARIGEMYGHLADLHAAVPLPDDEWLRVRVHHGEDRPGYDEALAHLTTCVEWASHHGVAPRWAQRCEQRLHALDPERYPMPSELSGHASYQPTSFALPSPAAVNGLHAEPDRLR